MSHMHTNLPPNHYYCIPRSPPIRFLLYLVPLHHFHPLSFNKMVKT